MLGRPQRDERGQADIDTASIEQRHARLDDALILQPLDAAPAGVARQSDPFLLCDDWDICPVPFG